MTIFYPDIYSGQAGMSFAGAPVAMVKATQGTGYRNSDYTAAQVRARAAGALFCAYHFLTQGNGAGQADFCFNVVGKNTPLMLDWEVTAGSDPTVSDAQAFVSRYKALGGIVVLNYLPHWYWNELGNPSLKWFADQGMVLVSSDYTTYSDNGPGWVGYGGMNVLVWQYTSTHSFNGYSPVDFNAYKGTIAQFEQLVKGTPLKPEDMILNQGDSGSAVTYLQGRLNVWGAKLTVDSSFGPATLAAVKAFQTKEKLTVDGSVGPSTWAALDKTPVTPPPPPPTGAFAAPAAFELAGKKTSVGIKWTAITATVDGKLPTGYTVQCFQQNGVQVDEQVVTTNSARFDNLNPGWTYTFLVWANGGTVSPAHAQVKITA